MSILRAMIDIVSCARMAETVEPPTIHVEFRTPKDREAFRRQVEDELTASVYSGSDPGGHGDRYRFAIAGLDVRLTLPDPARQ